MTNYFEMYTQTHKLNLRPFYHLTFKCDLDLQATLTNVSNGTSTPQENKRPKRP